jgi:hypothetical protein
MSNKYTVQFETASGYTANYVLQENSIPIARFFQRIDVENVASELNNAQRLREAAERLEEYGQTIRTHDLSREDGWVVNDLEIVKEFREALYSPKENKDE